MSSTDPQLHLPDNFADAERFQRLFVLPVVGAVEKKIEGMLQPLIDSQQGIKSHLDQQDTQIAKLVKDQKKALLGWSVYASAAAAALAWGWNWIKGHIRLG